MYISQAIWYGDRYKKYDSTLSFFIKYKNNRPICKFNAFDMKYK